MKLISVNVGQPRLVDYDGRRISTGIFKNALEGTVQVGRLNLAGDRQADLRVHGGERKAVYLYPSEHYEYWRAELRAVDLPWGAFGENLTTEGLLENEVRSGDRLLIGTVEFAVTTPRYPCFKLGIRFGRTDVIRRFAKSGRSGFYLSVVRTGEIGPGDEIEHIPAGRGQTMFTTFTNRMTKAG
ncbi:MAG TPA: MOSC domain-containing protein [Pyrinomonadaceae bacterium]